MKIPPGNKALSDTVSIVPDKPGVQSGSQSLFSRLLEFESQLRKEDRIKAKVQKGSMVEKLSRYIE